MFNVCIIIGGYQCVNVALSGPFCVFTVSAVAGFVRFLSSVKPRGRRPVFQFVYFGTAPALVCHSRRCEIASEVGCMFTNQRRLSRFFGRIRLCLYLVGDE